jgi:hypothetical protein
MGDADPGPWLRVTGTSDGLLVGVSASGLPTLQELRSATIKTRQKSSVGSTASGCGSEDGYSREYLLSSESIRF